MKDQNSKMAKAEQKVKEEFTELAWVFSYLALYFCAVATYSMLLLNKFEVRYFTYGAALINALVLSKVILIGEAAHLGKRSENRRLIVSAVFKAFIFSVFAAALHVIEEIVRELVHGHSWTSAIYALRFDDVLIRNLIIFGGFIPFFAFWEMRRVLGEERFSDLLFRKRATTAR